MGRTRLSWLLVVSLFAASCAATWSETDHRPVLRTLTPPIVVAPEVLADLAPNGKLRASINFGNPILANRDPDTKAARGVSVDLSRELARRLGVSLELVLYESAGKVVDGLKDRSWDVGYIAIDPLRANDAVFTAPYLVIEGAYLVAHNSPIRSNADVDRNGVRVVVGAGSAYDLYLNRALKAATLVRAPTSPAVADVMVAGKLEVAAGVRQQLEADARRLPGLRMLEGRFMVINQAMAMPKSPTGSQAGARYLHEFVELMKDSGFVAEALQRHRIEGAVIAGPQP